MTIGITIRPKTNYLKDGYVVETPFGNGYVEDENSAHAFVKGMKFGLRSYNEYKAISLMWDEDNFKVNLTNESEEEALKERRAQIKRTWEWF